MYAGFLIHNRIIELLCPMRENPKLKIYRIYQDKKRKFATQAKLNSELSWINTIFRF